MALLLGFGVMTSAPVAADATGTLSIIAGTGQEGAPTAGPATSSKLFYPGDVAVDSLGNVYIADTNNHVVEKVTPDGTLSIFAGTGTQGAPTEGPATSSNLDSPADVAVDSSDNVYIADSGNNRIEKVTPDGTLSIIAGDGNQGQPTAGPATSSNLSYPRGVAVDSSGNVYIADSGNNRIEMVSPDGTLSIFAGSAPCDPYDSSGTPCDPFAPRLFSPGTATDVNLNSPQDVAVDSAGNVYIADTFNRRIEKVDTNGVLSVVAGTGDWGVPAAGSATSSMLEQPFGVAVDSSGDVFIADGEANVVAKVDTNGVLSIIAGTGSYGSPTAGPATSSGLGGPRGVAVDSDGNVYIANTFGYSILKVSFATAPAAPTSLVALRGYGSAEISFTAGSDGGSAITNYKYSTDNGATWTAFSPAVTSSPVTIGGLTNGTTYNIKLRAVNSVGDGSVSDAVSVTPAVVDASSWTAQSPTAANFWLSVAYGNGLFVAISYDGSNRVMTSPDGVTWTARTAAAASGWWSVTYGNGLFVAVAYDGSYQVMTSPDGVTWTARTAAAASGWISVTYGNGLFVAVTNRGTDRVMTSPDGVTWTAQSAAEQNDWYSVTYGNGLFVATATAGSNRVMTSPDGVTWTAQDAVEANTWWSVAYGNGTFVAVASDGTHRVMTSPDGVTWTAHTGVAGNWNSVAYGNGLFVAVADIGSNQVMTSPDGVTWTAHTGVAGNWNSVAYGNGLFVAVAHDGSNRVMTSALLSAPAAPTSLVATPGDGSTSIAFTPGFNGGSAITKYQYKVGAGAWTDAVGTTSPITVSGLTNYQVSRIKLRAVNSIGTGVASVAVAVTSRPAGPAMVSARASGRTGLVVTFNLNPLPGTTVSYQSVTAYTRGTNTVAGTCRTVAKRTTCFIGGLTRGTDYDLRATAYLPVPGQPWHRATLEGSTLQVSTNR
jgi:DNA-binding beta-propeller fold protein YncE